jgi:hypothetical protein
MEGSLVAYKVFTNGSVLNASEMNEYLMNQSVITFSNSTARGSAITTPVEGMITYLEDTQTYESWDGAAWVAFGGGGAGTGNAIINGAFEINQRNFTSTTVFTHTFDRWLNTVNDGTVTASAQTFTPGSAPISGYEARNFLRTITTGQTAADAYALANQRIEDVRTFAGETVTLSFFAKAGSGTPKMAVSLEQNFGTGGSPSSAVSTHGGQVTLSTSWARYSVTISVPSIAGKTLGTNNNSMLTAALWFSAGTDFNSETGSLGIQSNTFDIWGVQLEAGSEATPFKRNANSLQGELAACQRYYFRNSTGFGTHALGYATSTTSARYIVYLPVTMRTTPTSLEYAGIQSGDLASYNQTITSLVLTQPSTSVLRLDATVASGQTAFRPQAIFNPTSAITNFLAFNAEL